jgi:signal transduction histidine kinase
MLGFGVTDLIGREVLGFVAAADRERVSSSLKTASEEPYEHAACRHDGSVFPVEVRGRAMPHRGRTVRVSAIRDLSARVEAERQLRRARTMEAMGSLVAGVAHEVRNPLFSISASVDALDSELGARPEIAEYAALLRSQVQRLGRLMQDLLDYGKPSVLRRGPTRLADVVRRAARSCAILGRERHVRVEEDLATDLPPLDIDAVRVEQALENLLANAIQHAPAGSIVRVAGRLEQTGLEPMARCTVEDEGPGVPVQSLEQVFEPFFSRRKGGTGLGLAIVQRVAEAHGGDVIAENRPGAGARFTLLLPVGRIARRAEGAQDV